jgi:rhodanese-related sulfurtransferase
MTRAPFVTIPLLAALLAAGCETGGPPLSDEHVRQMEYREVVEAMSKATQRRPVVLVDTRTPEQFAAGHIEGAINIPLIDLNPNDVRLDGPTVIVYHQEFKGDYAKVAAKKLLAGGLTDVYSYAGGYNDWMTRQATPQ